MKKRLYKDPGVTAASVDFFDSAVYNPVRDRDKNDGVDEGAPDDDPRED